MAFSTDNSQREAQFNSLVSENRQLICKVCYMYATDVDYFNDLYQETLANIWSAMDSFRGEARISTWRKARRHGYMSGSDFRRERQSGCLCRGETLVCRLGKLDMEHVARAAPPCY